MIKSAVIKSLCICTMLLVPMSSFAQMDGPEPGKFHHMCDDMNLTDEQKVKLKQLHQEIKSVRDKNFENARAIRMKIKDELLKESPSSSQLDSYASELGMIHKEIAIQHNNHLLKVKAVLTPEQFSRLVNKETDGFEKSCNGMGKGGPHGAPCKKECMGNRNSCKGFPPVPPSAE